MYKLQLKVNVTVDNDGSAYKQYHIHTVSQKMDPYD